jgi:protein O-mannosyl-transferase
MTPNAPSARPHTRLFVAGCHALLLAAVAAIYAPILRFSFVDFDDQDLVLGNPQLTSPTLANLGKFWTTPFGNLYVPLSYSFFWVAARATGGALDPLLFHAISFVLHQIAAALVFSILRDCLGGCLWPLAGALLFAMHPLQVESVAWVSETDNVLAGVLSLAAIRLYLVFARSNSQNRRHWYAAATIALLLALFAKPTAVVAPLIAAVLDRVFVKRPYRSIARAILPWIFIAGAFVIIAHFAQRAPHAPHPEPWDRLAVAGDAMMFYLVKLFWPVHLTIDYARTPDFVLSSGAGWAGLIVLLAICFLLFFRRKRLAGVVAGFAILAIGLSPTLGLISFDFQRFSTVADRYIYLAMLGAALAAAWGLGRIPNRAAYAVMLLFIPLIWLTHNQISHWRDSDALAGYTLNLDPMSVQGNRIAAAMAATRKQWDRAIDYELKSLVRNPDDGDALYDLGNYYLADDDYAKAIEAYQLALPLLGADMQIADMNNMGIAYYKNGDTKDAESAFNAILRVDPNNAGARKNLDLINGVPSK